MASLDNAIPWEENLSSPDREKECSCAICCNLPRLSAALNSMRPPSLRLYRHEEMRKRFQEDVEAAGSDFDASSSLWHLCSRSPQFPIYEVFTEELVSALASYLSYRVFALLEEQRTRFLECQCGGQEQSCCASDSWKPRPVVILDGGSGTGLLATHLIPRLEACLTANASERAKVESRQFWASARDGEAASRKALFHYVCCEPRGKELQICDSAASFSTLGVRRALKKWNPDIVIFSWMPFNVDFTQDVRSNACQCCQLRRLNAKASPRCVRDVSEYILIGQAEKGLVGKPLETWGVKQKSELRLPAGVDAEAANALPREKEEEEEKAALHWQQRCAAEEETRTETSECTRTDWNANAFSSLLPETTSAEGEDNAEGVDGDEADLKEGQILELNKRWYFVEGFERLLALAQDASSVSSLDAREVSLIRDLQNAPQLCRFDSSRNFLEGVKSSSRVVIFRRRLKKP